MFKETRRRTRSWQDRTEAKREVRQPDRELQPQHQANV